MKLELFVLFLLVGLCRAGDKERDDKRRDDKDRRDDGRERIDSKIERYDENRDTYNNEEWDEDDDCDDNLAGWNNGNGGNLGGGENVGTPGSGNGGNLGSGSGGKLGSNGGNLDGGENTENLSNIGDNRRNRNRRCKRYYPCDFEDDKECVRHYFATSGQCKETHNYGHKPVYRSHLVAFLPGFNVTLYKGKSRIKFINDRISRFYINKRTDNLVMAVDFDNINIETRYSTFVYQRRGQEPIKRTDFTNVTIPVTLTAVIPLKKEIDFKISRVTAYLPSIPQSVQVGPRILQSTNPTVVRVNTAIFANLPQAVLELFLTEAPSLYFGYLQKYLCDFGIPIS